MLQFVNTLSRVDGGPAQHAWNLNQALNQVRDEPVQLISIGARTDDCVASMRLQRAVAQPHMEPLFAANGASGRPSLGLWRALRRIRHADAVIVHGYFLWWVPLVVLSATAWSVPVTLMPHGALNEYDLRKRSTAKRLWSSVIGVWLDRQLATVVVASENEASQVRQRGRFRSVTAVGAGSRVTGRLRTLGPVHDPLELVSISRIAPKKRLDLALRCVSELSDRGRGVHLTIAGTGDEELVSELVSMADDLGIAELVDFVGQLDTDAINAALQGADVFLAPSDDENFGIATAEAMVAGVPVVASSAVDAAMFIQTTGAKVLKDVSPRLLADAVEELADNDEFTTLSRGLSLEAAAAFSWQAVAQRWSAALDGQLPG
ncbi:glycosyltransferase family 4 protein [Demequina rhizosphaerae]|uniref:glycosyltransferase family 4 protein n=1 Tax=Demequina rhizosphaerae TaxID=1638985 RepID=UPI00155A463D|nr:glycosyltransferase [Demequina rhizosphaerae]